MPEPKTTVAEQPANDAVATALAQLAQTQQMIAQLIAQQGNSPQIAEAIDALRANAVPRQKTVDECDPVSPFNPKGVRNRDLGCIFYQNGVRVEEHILHDEEIALLKHLTPGTFIEGLAEVTIRTQGGVKTVYLDTKTGSREQAMELKNHARNLTEIMKRCAEEGRALQS